MALTPYEKMKGPVPSKAGSGKVFRNKEDCRTVGLSPPAASHIVSIVMKGFAS